MPAQLPTKEKSRKRVIIVCGPTASGKTGYAHALAMRNIADGILSEIVNCDSMQIYTQIPIITASPEQELKQQLPYHLYNFKSIEGDFSVAEYIDLARVQVRNILSRGALPIIVGGTGMYISSLIGGINSIPEIAPEIRTQVRNMYDQRGAAEIHSELLKCDPIVAAKLNMRDSQRVMRALEVMIATGRSISEFQNQPKQSPLPEVQFEVIMLSPSRELLYEMCNNRLSAMFDNGAIEEVECILKSGLQFGLSSAKALAVPQIISYLQGNITKKEALEIASAKTRQYAKRQTTWFNRPLWKLATVDKMQENFRAQNHSVVNLREDSSAKLTQQFASEVEFPKRSINQLSDKKVISFSNIEEYKKIIIATK